MADLFRYLNRNDCIITSRRVYNIRRGVKSRDFVRFGRLEFGLVKGPFLAELEKGSYFNQRQQIVREVDCILDGISRNAMRHSEEIRESGDLVQLAEQVIEECSFADPFSPKHNIARRSAPALHEIKDSVIRSIMPGHLGTRLGERKVLLVGGISAELRRSDAENSEHYAVLNRERLVPCGEYDIFRDIRESAEQVSAGIKEQVEKLCGRDGLETRVSGKGRYSEERNIGYRSLQEGFFVYTKLPSYILKDQQTRTFFRFPPATVAVKVEVSSDGSLYIESPIVIERYKHPALCDINRSMQDLCWQYRKRDYSRMPPNEKIAWYLHGGMEKLATDYRSSHSAHHNLADPEKRKDFLDLVVELHDVRQEDVRNLRQGEGLI
ncbi:hypothetical protein KY363_01715 [Candidatus Woesearchaeota archaeon]|nr:hypothetical protein [Candidatus Woesearchaeota archaeon]